MKLSKILILLCLFCVLLAGCGDTADHAVDPGETTAPEEKEMLVLVGGADSYTLIRDEDFGQIGTAATVALHKFLDNAIGLDTDWVQKGGNLPSAALRFSLAPLTVPSRLP